MQAGRLLSLHSTLTFSFCSALVLPPHMGLLSETFVVQRFCSSGPHAGLDSLNLSEKTLVIFTGDNGSFPTLHSTLKGREMNGDKGRPTDAGTHVPLIAQWKGHIKAGQVNQDLIDFTDFLPTLAEITGANPPADITIDGQSFAPQLRGQKGKPREWIFCHYDPRWANFKFSRYAQDKRYKLYFDGALFDYRQDPLEKSPIAKEAMTATQAEVRQKLQKVLDTLK